MPASTILFAIGGIAALAYASRLLATSPSSSPPANPLEKPSANDGPPTKLDEQRITLEFLSASWTAGVVRKIPITELSRAWMTQPERHIQVPIVRDMVFKHQEITEFYRTEIFNKPFFTSKQLEAVIELLQELDEYGDCPSVVDKHPQETEKTLPADTYDRLKLVPLWQHTLNVANEMIKRTPRGPMTPKSVIAALAHDLGKIPKNYDPMCTSAVHGFISGMMIEYLPNLKSLRYSDEIIDSARLHHTPPEGNYLAMQLQKADQAARRCEMGPRRDNIEEAPSPPEALPAPEPASLEQPALFLEPESATPPPKAAAKPRTSTKKGQEPAVDALGMPTAASATNVVGDLVAPKTKGKQMEIPWFDVDKLKQALAAQVNKPLPGERFWGGISMPDGMCYFKLNAFWHCIKKAFGDEPAVKAADRQMEDNIMLSVSNILVTAGATPAAIVRKDQIGAMFIINRESAKPADLYLFPIKSESLGLDVQDCEMNKPGQFRATKTITPKFSRPAL